MSPERNQRWQNIGIIVGTAVIALILVWVNTYQRMAEEYGKGEELLAKQEYLKAITAYETAIHAYVPWSAKVRHSADRLWEIGGIYEAAGEVDLALIAYRSLRSSFYAVRSFYQPFPEWIEKCDGKIPALMKIQEEDERRRARARAEGLPEPGDELPADGPASEEPAGAEAAPETAPEGEAEGPPAAE